MADLPLINASVHLVTGHDAKEGNVQKIPSGKGYSCYQCKVGDKTYIITIGQKNLGKAKTKKVAAKVKERLENNKDELKNESKKEYSLISDKKGRLNFFENSRGA